MYTFFVLLTYKFNIISSIQNDSKLTKLTNHVSYIVSHNITNKRANSYVEKFSKHRLKNWVKRERRNFNLVTFPDSRSMTITVDVLTGRKSFQC
jgi:hypothetical protein